MRLKYLLLLCVIVGVSCSDSKPTGPSPPPASPGDTLRVAGGSLVVFQDGGRLSDRRATIERLTQETIEEVRGVIPIDGIVVEILSGSETVIPHLGFGGRAVNGTTVLLTFDPSSVVLESQLEPGLFPLLAHELHHIARQRTVGYGNNLLGAMISEGLADQFSIEVAGIEPPRWSTALSPDELQTWSALAEKQWFNENYNHSAWFFGDSLAIPRWAGYTIGFEMTGTFLRANPSRRPSDLYNEPARSFIP